METQNQIKRTLSQAIAVEYIREQLDSGQFINRSQLASFLCKHFDFYDIRGDEQLSGCLKGLRELEAAGRFTLPAAQKTPRPPSPRRLSEPVPAAEPPIPS